MARFYSNENFPLPVVQFLREMGHDVLTTEESGHSNQAISDEDILKFSIRENRVVLTFNRKHFIKLHLDENSHSGIVVCTFDRNFNALAKRIDDAVRDKTNLQNELIRVNRDQQS